jgi:hypothetical protein
MTTTTPRTEPYSRPITREKWEPKNLMPNDIFFAKRRVREFGYLPDTLISSDEDSMLGYLLKLVK